MAAAQIPDINVDDSREETLIIPEELPLASSSGYRVLVTLVSAPNHKLSQEDSLGPVCKKNCASGIPCVQGQQPKKMRHVLVPFGQLATVTDCISHVHLDTLVPFNPYDGCKHLTVLYRFTG